MDNSIQGKIVSHLHPVSEGIKVADIRIGLGYSSVHLDNGNMGVAWTAHNDSGNCTHENRAGKLAGSPASELLEMLVSAEKPLSRTIGLATANALVAGLPGRQFAEKDAFDMVGVNAEDKVVMVGFFGPVIPKLKQTGCKLDVLELKSNRPGTISPEDGGKELAECSVAIITATSIITDTFDDLMAGLGNPRAVIVLGPSTLMYPPVFTGTPVTHLAGSLVKNASGVKKIVSEGGGTMILKQYLDFKTVCM
ncbi:MAG: DUF364 domain-containing protein [Dehalococcoidales bacterium]|jgi:hypothetical protein|nr:DUF364 domain-containing protein [Dehalococcoidales bacterium]NLT28700.1 DUF364 domain-containing protein [Dehalococcoidales bacterium]